MRSAVAVAVSIVVLSGCVAIEETANETSTAPLDSQKLTAAVPHETLAEPPVMRLDEGLVPPTNRWFSGLVFGEHPQPVFPMPLAVEFSGTGFTLGLPSVTTSAAAIIGGFERSIGLATDATEFSVSAYDAASVTVTHRDAGGQPLGRTVIARGWPFVSYTSDVDQEVGLSAAFQESGDGIWTTQAAGTEFGLALPHGSPDPTSDRLELAAGTSLSFFATPEGGSAADLGKAALDPVIGVQLSSETGTDSVTTTLRYRTRDGSPTLMAAMPHQDAEGCDSDGYPSVYGTLRLCEGTELGWSQPRLAPDAALDLSALSDDDRAALRAQVESDTAETEAFPADTYFGGKALYRAAMLLQLARELGVEAAADDIRERLGETLSRWAEPQGCADRDAFCFVYDEAMRGVVGKTPSFGSEAFNDHHFHYGYFLFAAAVLAADSPDYLDRLRPVVDLLAADIAGGDGDTLPELRVFDAYAGHSWASGLAPFADGNNQESSSEAVTAWAGLGLWADVSGNGALAEQAAWLMSNEAASAKAYWTDFDRRDPVYEGFEHEVVSLNWGGKRDYATWFSAEPNAMLGILLIPMSPVADYLAGDPERIRANLTEAAPAGYDVQFGDYLLMYRALAGPDDAERALAAARELPEERIDDGNSRSYLLAWIMSHR